MFLEEAQIIKDVFFKYFGDGKYLIVFMIALIVIAIEEKKKENKNFLVYYTIVMFVIILNPIFGYIIFKFVGQNVYFRMFWMIPMGIVMAYFFTILISKLDKKKLKVIMSIACTIVLIYAGQFMYSKENFEKINNWYKVPREYVEVIEILSDIPLKHKKVVTTTDMVGYIRQIDANIKLSFPRRTAGDYNKYKIVDDYYQGRVENLTKRCKAENTNIIVFQKNLQTDANFSDFGFDLYAQTNYYDIYVLREN